MAVKAVFFDVGETLSNEAPGWAELARRAGMEPHVVWAAVGVVIERRQHHRAVFELLGREHPGWSTIGWDGSELYPDAIPCLKALREAGYFIGIAGNAGGDVLEPFVERHGLDVDFIGSSSTLGVEKPAPGFFARLIEAGGAAPAETAYVGDRLDNDVVPAAEARMRAIFLRRGPWGYLQASWPEAERAHARIDSLAELQAVLHDEL
jgi:HAD superfamily hydrolase (TIGR01549 family)